MDELTYKAGEYLVEEKRHVAMTVDLPIKPYVRQTRNTRWRRDSYGKAARDYNDSINALRDAMVLIMRKEGIQQFGKVPLGCAITVRGDVARADLGNLEKAVEDALNRSLWYDDHYVYVRGVGEKVKSTSPSIQLHVWEL
jgi:Holliday junction resolvase RusA-like endonuclease